MNGSEGRRRGGPGAILPPPLVFLGALAAGLLASYLSPLEVLPAGENYLCLPVLLAGLILAGYAVRTLVRSGASPDPREETAAFVTAGPYRFTRNPIYLGFAISYAGAALFANSAWALFLLVPVMLYIDLYQVRREERYLSSKFGEEYSRYARRVRRWL
jgi:protein-S-isoprenylcysteine O-methyltransferase Ste14